MEALGIFVLGAVLGLVTGFVAAVKILVGIKQDQDEAEIGDVARD